MSLALWFLTIVFIMVAADLTKKILLGQFVTSSPTFEIFFKKICSTSYSLIVVTFLCWLFFRESSEYMLAFSTLLMIELLRIDYKLLEESYQEIREMVLDVE
jgi:hypothetical protein